VGWIESEDSGESPAAIPTEPLAGSSEDEAPGDGLSVGQIYERSAPGVVFIEAVAPTPEISPFGPFEPPEGNTATGSGFVIDDDGSIVTNAHVVTGAERITVSAGEDSEPVEAELVGEDISTDVALLRVDPEEIDLHPLPLGSSDDAKVGAPVVAIGNPFGLDRTVTTGIVSALQREIEAPNGFVISDVIQTDAAINPGNSGGPLLDSRGRVIGINSQIATAGGGGSVGVGFAVPVNTAREVINQLQDTGEVRRAYLGVEGTDLTEEIADVVNLDQTSGALLQRVVPDGPADDAGLEAGDAIVEIGGRPIRVGGDIIVEADGEDVETMDDVVRIVSEKKPGDDLQLVILRDGEEDRVTVELGERPASVTG
jgi:S1-C subfamily serine protease